MVRWNSAVRQVCTGFRMEVAGKHQPESAAATMHRCQTAAGPATPYPSPASHWVLIEPRSQSNLWVNKEPQRTRSWKETSL